MQRIGPLWAVLLALAVFFAASLSWLPDNLAQAADSQQTDVRMLDDLREAVSSQYRADSYNQYLKDLIADQQAAMAAIAQQRQNYEKTRPEIVPVMQEMIRSLGRFVETDLPFDLEYRQARVAELGENMGRSEMALAEKFRRILDAYQVEMSYGREIDAKVGWLAFNGAEREVNFLRLGRLVLAYQTHDGSETGFFNTSTRQWETLPDKYRDSVAAGLRIARKQAAPVLLRLPVPAAGAAE